MTREYFYRNAEGNIVPYHYCSECGKRYTNEEFKENLIVNVGTSITPIKYCVKTCLDIKFPDQKPQGLILPKKIHDVEDEFEEIIPKEMEPERLLEDSEGPTEEVIEEIEPTIEKVKKVKSDLPVKKIESIESLPPTFEEDLRILSGRQIVEKVKTEKGIQITCSLKSKKVILKKALEIYKGIFETNRIAKPKAQKKESTPIVEKTEPSTSPFEKELNNMSAKQIVEKVKAEKEIEITVDLRSKKMIVNRALAYQELVPITFNSLMDEFNSMSAKQIMEKVKAEKGIEITCSIKSKKAVVKQALKIYGENV